MSVELNAAFEQWREAYEAKIDRRFSALERRVDTVEATMVDLKGMVANIAAGVARIEGWERYFQQVAEIHAAIVPEAQPDPDPTPNMRGPR